jgi:MoxR-like ATPase
MSATAAAHALIDAVATAYRGPRPVIELAVAGWIARGHLLVEDLPGTGKTTLARALALAVGGTFRRIQGTPDLMPADITGVSVWDEREHAFRFVPGPVFADVLLADELNRAPPRTQSALLEALSENAVTVDGQPRPLAARFVCLATQNPLDQAGTYPLPDGSRDRFLLRLRPGPPDAESERAILAADGADRALAALRPVLDPAALDSLRAAGAAVQVDDTVRAYAVALARATRAHRRLALGASTRAALGLQRLAQARALIAGRGFTLPDDVQEIAPAALLHRLVARGGADAEEALRECLDTVPAPR